MYTLKRILATISLVLILFGCNKIVQENRDVCPCILTLDLTKVDENIDELHLWFFGKNGEILYRDTIGVERYALNYNVEISREMVNYFVWGNIKSSTELKDNLTINSSITKVSNKSADSLYYFANIINTNTEFARDTVELSKEFITVDVQLKGEPKGAKEVEVELQGNSIGFYVDKRFLSGLGRVITKYTSSNIGSSCFSYRITRQETLSNLEMRITTERAGAKIEIASFPLGNWLRDNGYKMQAKNLSDIKMVLDLSSSFVTIKVDDWSVTNPINMEL